MYFKLPAILSSMRESHVILLLPPQDQDEIISLSRVFKVYRILGLLVCNNFTPNNFGSKITADGDCSHEIKRCLLLGRKVMTNLDSILKSRDITLPTKVRLVKAMVFPVVMYVCQSWTIKKAECRRTDAFELWCWRRLLRVS